MNRHLFRLFTVTACVTLWAQAAAAKPARHFRTLHGHKSFLIQISPAASSKFVASVAQDGTARVWQMPNGRKLAQMKAAEDETFEAIAVAPDGKHVAIAVGANIRLYSVKRYKAKKLMDIKGHAKTITSLTFDKAGTTLASCSDGVRLWNLKGKEIAKLAPKATFSHVTFAPSGEVVGVQANSIHFYGRTSLKEARKVALAKIQRVTFSADGKKMAVVGTNSTLTVTDAAGKKLWSKESLASETFAVFSPGDKMVVSAFNGDKVIAHDAKTGALKWFVNGKEGISVLTIKGKVLVTGGGEGRLWLWKMR